MTEDNYRMQDPERMAYLQIINTLLKLVAPDKLIELERLEIEKSMAIMEQIEQYKRKSTHNPPTVV